MTGRGDSVAAVFDLLDQWRHFPSYQLERRADISLHSSRRASSDVALGVKVDARMIPEFSDQAWRTDNQSTK